MSHQSSEMQRSSSRNQRLVAMLVLGIVGSSHGFGVNSNMRNGNAFHTTTTATTSSRISSPAMTRPTSSLNAFSMEDVSYLYAVYPLQSAIVTCGVKASIADAIAQFQAFLKIQNSSDKASDEENAEMVLELRRNFAYFIYGSIFVGAMCHLEYNVFFPYLFGTSHEWTTVIKKQFFDNFISGPWLWLPPAYFIKAIMMDYPLAKGWENYVHDVKHEGLLFKYWALWIPAQSITFSVIPDHLRVAFMASVSFFWFILFSALSANGASDPSEEPTTVSELELPQQLELAPVTVSATTATAAAALRRANTTATF